MCALLPLLPLVPLIPLIGISSSLGASPSSGIGSSTPSTPIKTPVEQPTEAQTAPENGLPKSTESSNRETASTEKGVLAQTGANTITLFIIGMMALILGGFLLSRRNKTA
ncbi:LPXTG cell wall anchor domain-containing protein [Corynebacterium meridianum]|uniref:LPXTG cell wall anchor domain-containing protein n=1 Tax=Corynebacterium meridianum TaxID=2765363 RepID=UPI003D05396C